MTSLDLAWAVRRVDGLLRQRQGIFEIADDRDCILRISLIKARHGVTLSDGDAIAPGDVLIQIHYWNEHLPLMPPNGPNARWAGELLTRLRYSFCLLADRLERDPSLAAVRGVEAVPAFAVRFGGAAQLARICERFGFDIVATAGRAGVARRIHDFFDGLFVWGLIRAFNPGALKNHGWSHRRIKVWISRRKLIKLYGGSPARGPDPRDALAKNVESI